MMTRSLDHSLTIPLETTFLKKQPLVTVESATSADRRRISLTSRAVAASVLGRAASAVLAGALLRAVLAEGVLGA